MASDSILSGSGTRIVIRKVKSGEKISEPGVYDIPMGWYHDDCCVGPSISSSGLRKIWTHSPQHYWHTSPMNPNRSEDDDVADKKAVRIGRAAHTLMLEPETFRKLFVTRPAIINGKPVDSWRSGDAKDWRAERQKAGITVMDPDEMQLVVGICKALQEHPMTKAGLIGGEIERAIIWQDEKTGVWLKSRPDAIPIGSNILADIKCVTDARTEQFSNAAFDAGYDMQLALGGVGMLKVLDREIEEFVLVACESKAPHVIRIAPVDPEEIGVALSLLRWSINKFAECWEKKSWLAFEDEDNTHIRRRSYKRKWIEDLIEHGALPKEF